MIIFINGSINSGKSTVAKLLSEKIQNSALVEIDDLHKMISWMPISEAVPLNLQNAISLIKNFSAQNIHSIVPYPLSQKNHDFTIEQLKDTDNEIHIFTMAPVLEKVLTNRGSREITEAEQERIKYHYSIGIPNPSFGIIIDNSEQSPEETATYILSQIK